MRMEETTTGSVTDSAGTKPSATPSDLRADSLEMSPRVSPKVNHPITICSISLQAASFIKVYSHCSYIHSNIEKYHATNLCDPTAGNWNMKRPS